MDQRANRQECGKRHKMLVGLQWLGHHLLLLVPRLLLLQTFWWFNMKQLHCWAINTSKPSWACRSTCQHPWPVHI
jgi:hypothetical protein